MTKHRHSDLGTDLKPEYWDVDPTPTPDMLEAGVDALHSVIGADERYTGHDERVVTAVFRAMLRLARPDTAGNPGDPHSAS